MIYIASPYTHKDKAIEEKRFVEVAKATAHFVKKGAMAFSPIVHGHSLVEFGGLDGMDEHNWLDYDFKFLEMSALLLVLAIDGWEESRGVRAEIAFAKRHGVDRMMTRPPLYKLERLKD